ncbi:hypothetical protein I9018_15090 [Pseudomonas sp. MPFS]|uniref:DUF6555 family protein n=1 Tax=Pseudomonas sp. MPFS TaxID=2795724 RepID=UPI001F1364C7|nr:DUF6555 family protein [Pseudomonas sp. MPFS]UMZ14941.1 hypothetical protein I9018_15090 [Pseudomonas sp. MPFS]
MSQETIYRIQYLLHGQPRFFVIRAKAMDNAKAWHWASCDAGIGIIPKSDRDPVKKVSKPLAEKYGITAVEWSHSARLYWTAERQE